MHYKIIIAGSRDFNDYTVLKQSVYNTLKDRNISKENVEIISGTARGADQLGERYAQEFGLKLKQFPADWSLGKGAGHIRNKQMAEYARDNGHGVLLAFWDGKSNGTKSMIGYAQKCGLEVHVFDFSGKELN